MRLVAHAASSIMSEHLILDGACATITGHALREVKRGISHTELFARHATAMTGCPTVLLSR